METDILNGTNANNNDLQTKSSSPSSSSTTHNSYQNHQGGSMTPVNDPFDTQQQQQPEEALSLPPRDVDGCIGSPSNFHSLRQRIIHARECHTSSRRYAVLFLFEGLVAAAFVVVAIMALEENMQPELTFRFAETAHVGDYISNTFVKTFFDTFLDRNGNMPH
eukprot:PhM_4_TR18011/c0_g1_i1/m.33395